MTSNTQHTFGIMQGRLSAPEDGRFQSFPRSSWRTEFARARAAGFSYIEWIHDDFDGWRGEDEPGANPIFTEAGLREFDALKAEHDISTPALCGDWFMEHPLIRCTPEERIHREQHLHALLPIARRIGARRIVLPFVDNASMKTEEERFQVLDVLKHALPVAASCDVELHLEADFSPDDFRQFLARLEHPLLKVNWDSGNSSGLGYRASEEFAAYGDRVGSVHIKDRYRKPEGGIETRPLGTGSADFEDVFHALRTVGYDGGVTLQVARGTPGDEVNFLRQQLHFVKRYW
ncbi:MAG: sugar phosphate isomerase/epimerase [Rhodospirillales bacterium]|nr:sugar phosphate isomerase/epimerase [Acetobacter sp.]